MRAAILVTAILLAAIGYGLSRGAVSADEIVHDTPAFLAYLTACVAGVTAGHLWGREVSRRRQRRMQSERLDELDRYNEISGVGR